MAGKCWHPSHEPLRGREKKQAPVTLIKQWKETGREKGGTAYEKNPHAQENATLKKMLTKHKTATMPFVSRAPGILAHAHI